MNHQKIGRFLFAIDPSINNTGWSYLFCNARKEDNENQFVLLDYGVFKNLDTKKTILEKMRFIFESIYNKLSKIHVDDVVIEETLVNINPFTSLKLSKGQSAAICGSLLKSQSVYIYNCKSARKTLMNNGNACKKQCRIFVQEKLGMLITNEHVTDSIIIGMNHYLKIIAMSTMDDDSEKESVKKRPRKKSNKDKKPATAPIV